MLVTVLGLLAGCAGMPASSGSASAGRAAPPRTEAGQQDLTRLLQEMTSLSKSNEVIRQLTEERLTRLSTDLGARVDSSVAESETARAALQLRLDELLREMRLIQGKLEENSATLSKLQTRVDATQGQMGTAMRRLEGMEQRVQAGGQEARAGQAKVEESASLLNTLHRRVDGTDTQIRTVLRRLEGLEQHVRSATPGNGSPPSAPPVAQAPQAPSPPPTAAAPATPPGRRGSASAPQVASRGSAPAGQSADDLYKDAFGNYARGEYDSAIAGFRSYVANYPKTSLAPSAQYWLAESLYSQNNYSEAIKGFSDVLREYPSSDKAPSALFRQGEVFLQLNDTKQAVTALCGLISKYPKSREAEMAKEHVRCG